MYSDVKNLASLLKQVTEVGFLEIYSNLSDLKRAESRNKNDAERKRSTRIFLCSDKDDSAGLNAQTTSEIKKMNIKAKVKNKKDSGRVTKRLTDIFNGH